MTNKELSKFINQLLKEETNFDFSDAGQGSGSQTSTQKGAPIDVDDVQPGMKVIITYGNNAGQGSGSQGDSTISGIVKSVTDDQIFMPVKDLYVYTKAAQRIYQKYGIDIDKNSIINITTI